MINVGIIGLGSFGETHAKTIANIERLTLKAVCRTNVVKLEQFCDKHKVLGYTDYRELLKNSEINAVVISTPHHLHTQIALDSIAAKKNILLEKPMAPTVQECHQIINEANKTNITLMVAQTLRFHPATIAAHHYLKTNELGATLMAKILWADLWNTEKRKPWHLQQQSQGGMLRTIGVHYIDLCNYIFNSKVKSVYASIKTAFSNYESDDSVTLHLKYKNGAEATIDCLGYQEGTIKMKADFFNEKGIISIDYKKGVTVSQNEKESLEFPIDLKQGLIDAIFNQWIEFRDALYNKRKPSVTGIDGLETIKIIEAAIESSKTGCTIHL